MFSKKLLSNIRIILVEPAGSLNIGSVARVMKNMGLSRLVLVNPQCDHISSESLQMAVHASDLLKQAEIVPDLITALKGVNRAIGTIGRSMSTLAELETPGNALPWLLADNLESALIFGPEDRGLSNAELNYAQRHVCIPSSPEYPSLNLAQAVAICAYELYQLSNIYQEKFNISKNNNQGNNRSNLASLDILDGYYQHLESTLLKIGYLYPHTAKARMEKLRRLFNKAQLSEDEVNIFRGILSQVDWYGKQKFN